MARDGSLRDAVRPLAHFCVGAGGLLMIVAVIYGMLAPTVTLTLAAVVAESVGGALLVVGLHGLVSNE